MKPREVVSRWWRPLVNVSCIIAVPDILIIQPHMGIVLSDERTWAFLLFIGSVLGLRSFEKSRGIADGYVPPYQPPPQDQGPYA